MELKKQLISPCTICLVRSCCSESCDTFRDYILDVLNKVVKNPNHEVLKQFSEHQIVQIRSLVKIIKG